MIGSQIHRNDNEGSFILKFNAFDTNVCIKAYADVGTATDVLNKAKLSCHEYENVLSRTLPNSDISRINSSRGEKTYVHPIAAEITKLALGYCAKSEGKFDMTIGSVSKLWDLKQGIIPPEDALKDACEHVDDKMIRIGEDKKGHWIRLADPYASLDLGGIAKGWIADSLGSMMDDANVPGYLIDLGGNILVGGSKPDGSLWNIGLRLPTMPSNKTIALRTAYEHVVSLSKGSVVTSGLYERAFIKDGNIYHHILDPKNGMPIQASHASVSVVCDRSIDAEGFSTTLLVLGPKRAEQLIQTNPVIKEVHFIDWSGHMRSIYPVSEPT